MADTFFVRLRGGSFQNADGTQRQELIANCRDGDRLLLRAEPDNPHDRHAVAVLNAQGQQLGYLPSDARDSSSILRGEGISATVSKRIGGPSWWHKLFGIERHYGLIVQLLKGPIDWSAHNIHRDRVQKIDAAVKEACAFEKSGAPPEEIIVRYKAAMAAVIEINRSDPVAAAHRYVQAPINRLTLLLVKEKRQSEAQEAYNAWRSVPDPVGVTKGDQESLARRMAKISAS